MTGLVGIGVGSRVASIAGALISPKIMGGIFVGVVLVMGAMLWKAGHDRDTAQQQVRDIGTEVAKAQGLDPSDLDPDDIVKAVKVIVVDRDTARRERDNFKRTAATQSKRVRELSAETQRLKDQAAHNVAAVRQITRDRDHWIAEAEKAAERTTELPPADELKKAEEALDAIYHSGF